ncbi:hypothetical protein KMZ14_12285 [Acinetobacter schindleri]|uniref:hypothetical protein n=1 Tax=Acinetobacter schindleri TaxID=108981 RepID=UPI0023604F48|nr:hypothetical protein [Acinetobacter schindleri]WDE15495.1 hypothetical protein KMZ14_12285 [Acinetobacter schindleri]
MKTMSVFRTSGVALNPISCGENWISIWQQMHDKTDPAMIPIKSAKYNRGGLSRNLGNSLSHPLFGNKPRKQGADHLPSTQYSFEILEPETFNKLKFTAFHHAGNATLQSASDIHIHDLINQVAVDGNSLNLYDHTQVSVMGLKHN